MGKSKQRNGDILKSYQKEINLSTKSIKSKKAYKRKQKYSNKDFE